MVKLILILKILLKLFCEGFKYFTKFEGKNESLIIYYGTEDFMSQSKTIYNED